MLCQPVQCGAARAQAEQQAEALRKAKEAPEGEANDFEKAAEFGRLRTVKVQQAGAQDETEREVAKEMAVRMRQAQRNMKGVKLQYTEAGVITFDDVAGIGDAKARGRPLSSAQRVPRAAPVVTPTINAVATLTLIQCGGRGGGGGGGGAPPPPPAPADARTRARRWSCRRWWTSS